MPKYSLKSNDFGLPPTAECNAKKTWSVQSSADPEKYYRVMLIPTGFRLVWACTCPDWWANHNRILMPNSDPQNYRCKHIDSVRDDISKELLGLLLYESTYNSVLNLLPGES